MTGWTFFERPREWYDATDDDGTLVEGVPDEVKRAGIALLRDDGRVLLLGHVNATGGKCGCCSDTGSTFLAWVKVEVPEAPGME